MFAFEPGDRVKSASSGKLGRIESVHAPAAYPDYPYYVIWDDGNQDWYREHHLVKVRKYLGETVLKSLLGTPYEEFNPSDWALEYISKYGSIDGGHHKQWVLDQVARILNGTQVIVSVAKWDDGHEEYRIKLDEPTDAYLNWVNEQRGEYNQEFDEYEYEYDEGIAP